MVYEGLGKWLVACLCGWKRVALVIALQIDSIAWQSSTTDRLGSKSSCWLRYRGLPGAGVERDCQQPRLQYRRGAITSLTAIPFWISPLTSKTRGGRVRSPERT